MWSGELMDKSLRLKAQDILETTPETLISGSIKNLIKSLPICANSIMGAVELGIITWVLWQYMGAASLICFVSFLSKVTTN